MAEVINMPLLSDTMEEGVIAAWHKKVGDKVSPGDLLAEIETDKATMDFESPFAGILLHIGVASGEALAVGKLLAVIGEKGEDISAFLSGKSPAAAPAAKAEAANGSSTSVPKVATQSTAPAVKVNAHVIQMPLLSDTMEEGTIAAWHKKVGDAVDNGDLLAEIETDKATMDFESPFKGSLLHIGVEAGSAIKVGALLAIIGEKGTDISALLNAPVQKAEAEAAPQVEKEEEESLSKSLSSSTSGEATASSNGRSKASPLAKAMAKERGIDLAKVNGSGTDGRIVKRDIENFKESAVASSASAGSPVYIPAVSGEESFEEVKLSQMRKAIARRLGESKFQAPHFYLTMEIDMDRAMAARAQLNEVAAPAKISFNDMVIKAAAAALRKHPDINASWMGDRIRYNHHIHIGMAVAVPEGLVVPVIRHVDQKGLSAISADARSLAGKARDKKLSIEEMQGNTFTISNLGMFGIEEFTAIINPPDACILAVGAIRQVPVVKNGEIVPGNRMKVTLSCDHRVVDGAKGAAFLVTFKELMEEPVRILL